MVQYGNTSSNLRRNYGTGTITSEIIHMVLIYESRCVNTGLYMFMILQFILERSSDGCRHGCAPLRPRRFVVVSSSRRLISSCGPSVPRTCYQSIPDRLLF